MNRVHFKVIVPAMKPDFQGVTKDPVSLYHGNSLPNGLKPVNVGPATVSGGTKVGGKWMGCTYTSPQFPIPGFGELCEA